MFMGMNIDGVHDESEIVERRNRWFFAASKDAADNSPASPLAWIESSEARRIMSRAGEPSVVSARSIANLPYELRMLTLAPATMHPNLKTPRPANV